MKQEKKENVQIMTAVGMLVIGSALSVAGFIVPPVGEISDSVLWFFAQCLIYAGSIFGITIYVSSKIGSMESKLMNLINKGHGNDNEQQQAATRTPQ